MGFLSKLFKKDYSQEISYEISKLNNYKEYIKNYDSLVEQLKKTDLDNVKSNVNRITKVFDYENLMEEKYGKELSQKIIEKVFIDMNEEQFDDHMKYQVITGKQQIYEHLPNGINKPYPIRKETITEKSIKVVRTNTTKRVTNKKDFVFVDDKLKEIREKS
jgi:hypothetical protein